VENHSISNGIVLAPEVAAAAEKLGVKAELPQVIAMTQVVFPGDAVRVEIDDDPEIADERHLAIVVRATTESVDQLVATQWKWHEQLFRCCPAPLTSVFRLATESAS
jgi:hypothetical protein